MYVGSAFGVLWRFKSEIRNPKFEIEEPPSH